jgi:beta-mannanase
MVAGAPLGNQYAKKLTTLELKEEAYRQYCAHLAKGKSKRSWCFEHEDMILTWETMEKYIAADKEVFDPIKKQAAEIKGYYKWEEIAELSAEGKNQANTASLQMVMRNKFSWDKESHVTHSVQPEACRLLKKMEE